MTAAVAVAAVAAMLATVFATTAAPPARRAAAVFTAGAVALCVLAGAGADLSGAAAALVSVSPLVGYSAFAVLLVSSGAAEAAAAKVNGRLWVLFCVAATVSLVTSNDVVVLVLAPIVVRFANPAAAAAVLFVGANASSMLLPQGSPTNLVIAEAAKLDAAGYVTVSAVPAAVVAGTAAAALLVAVPLAFRATASHRADPTPPSARSGPALGWLWALVAFAVPALAVADAVRLPRPAFAGLLLCAAAVAAPRAGVARAAPVVGAAWLVLPLVAVAVAAGQLLAAGAGSVSDVSPWVVFAAAAGLTDLAASGVAAELVGSGAVAAPAALVAVTAGAFASPAGSLSAVLLRVECTASGVKLRWPTYLCASLAALAAVAAGLAVA